jgi:hypothetical protein
MGAAGATPMARNKQSFFATFYSQKVVLLP